MKYLSNNKIFFFFIFSILFRATCSFSQSLENKQVDDILNGAIDIHIHSFPDVSKRSVTDFEVAELAQKKGLKAIVIKCHVSSTVGRAVLVNLKSEKIKVFGGIALNKAVGGINPDAVEAMYKMSPEYGKFVWFPTIDAAFYNQSGEGLTVLQDNVLNTQTIQVLKIIARENLILATGHLSPKEILLLVPEAKKMGVNKILITHATGNAPGLSIDQMSDLVEMGAVLEFTYLSFLTSQKDPVKSKGATLDEMARAIKQIGAKNFILSSDLGQVGNPPPPEGLKIFVQLLMAKGISLNEINLMIKTNPGKLLDIK